jgi:hypothetical protein
VERAPGEDVCGDSGVRGCHYSTIVR